MKKKLEPAPAVRGHSRRRAAPPTAARRVPAATGSRRWAAGSILFLLIAAACVLVWGSQRFLAPAPARTGGAPASTAVARAPEEQRLRDAITGRPGDPQPHAELADYLRSQGQLAEAAWEYQEASAAGGSTAIRLAATLAQMRLVATAIGILEDRLQRPPVPIDARRALAEIYLATGRPEEAVSVLLAGGAATRQSVPAMLSLGRARLVLGDLRNAEQILSACRSRAPQNPEVYLWLGEAVVRSGRPRVAREWWQKGAALAPADLEFPVRMAKSLLEERPPDSDRAGERLLTEPLRRAPRDPRLLLQSGLLHQRAGRHREAARGLLLAIKADPTAVEPHLFLADSLEALGETAEALRHRGLYYSLRDRPSRARVQFERFRTARPDSVDAPLLISQSLVQMQQNERAIAVAAAALKQHPRETALRESLATLYLMTLSRREAADTCVAWLREEPNAARPHWILGRAAQSNQRLDEAVSHFETAVAREPENPEYLAALGGALMRRASPQDLTRAKALFERSVALAPDAPDPRVQLGAIRLQFGDVAAALSEYLIALDLDPSSPSAYHGLVQVAQRLLKPHQVALWARATREVQDRRREETRLRREAGAQPQDPARFVALATALIRSGSLARAEGNLEEAVALRPDMPEARRLLARVKAVRAVLRTGETSGTL